MISGVLMLVASLLAASSVTIQLRSESNPPRVGRNAFEVVLSDPDGKRVENATVQVQLSRTSEPHMRRTIGLKHEGNGVYRGEGEMTRAGRWNVVAVVRRDGSVLGTRSLSMTVK
jgi:nitrogen fixation protein FixH